MNELLISNLFIFLLLLLMDTGQGGMLPTLSFLYSVCGFLEETRGLVLVTLEFCLVSDISEVTGDWMGFSCLKLHSMPTLKYPTAALLLVPLSECKSPADHVISAPQLGKSQIFRASQMTQTIYT